MLKKLKSIFIIEDEEFKNKMGGGSDSAKAQSPKKDSAKEKQPDIPVVQDPNRKGQISNGVMNTLLKALDQNNLEGMDYLEFKNSLKSLKSVDMDEKTRFQSAFAMGKGMGLTKSKLVKTAKFYIGILGKEENKFKEALAGQIERGVKGRAEQTKKIEAAIAAKQQKIQKLQQEIDNHKKQLEKSKGDIQKVQLKVDGTKKDFYATYEAVVKMINDDIKNIEQYIT